MEEMSNPLVKHLIGGDGGSAFEFDGRKDGAMLKKIWVWVGKCQVKCVKTWLTNGKCEQFGTPEGGHSEFEFQEGEIFSSLSLWVNEAGTSLGAIKFRTNNSRIFFVHMTDGDLKNENSIDIGSGICLGIVGRANEDINCMSFLFLNSVKRSELINVTYPTLNSVLPNIEMEELKSIQYENSGSAELSYKIETSKNVNKTSSWSIENGIEAYLSITVSAGIPEVANFEVSKSLTVSRKGTHNLQNSESKTETLSFDVKVPPRKTVSIEVNIGRIEVDLPYKATVHVELLNGSTFDIPVEGTYKGVSYTNAIVEKKKI